MLLCGKHKIIVNTASFLQEPKQQQHTRTSLSRKKSFKSQYVYSTRPFIFCFDLFCYYQTVNPCWTRGNDQLARLGLCVCNAVQPRPSAVVGTAAAEAPTNRNFKGRAHFRRRLWPYRHNIFPLRAALDIRPSADSGSGQLHVSRPKKAVAAAAAEASFTSRSTRRRRMLL